MNVMCTRLPILNFFNVDNLSGLSKRCDWFINGKQFINITDTNRPKFVFLRTYYGEESIQFFVTELLPKIINPFYLIAACTDYTFPLGVGDLRYNMYTNSQHYISALLDYEYFVHGFIENLDTTAYSKLSPIPLGFLTPLSEIDPDAPDLNNIDFNERDILCMCVHRIREGTGQWADRAIVSELCKNQWSGFVYHIDEEINEDDFIKLLKRSKFCLCIHGGGYDPCPKFFECILHGVIPIIQHSPLDAAFSRFPAAYIGDLNVEALSEPLLLDKLEDLREYYEGPKRGDVLKMLTLDYWWDIMNSTV